MPQPAQTPSLQPPQPAEARLTLSDLNAAGTFEELGTDLETLALMGTQLDAALISTRNSGAVIAASGGYGRYQPSTKALYVTSTQRRVTLRVAPHTPTNIAQCRHDPTEPFAQSLVTLDAIGQVQHRVQIHADHDRMVAASLPRAPHHETPQQGFGANVVWLSAVRQARAHWHDADAGMHLNDLMLEHGSTRCTTLPHLGRGHAWQVVPQVIPSFLTYLCNKNLPVVRAVPARGLLQMSSGVLGQASLRDNVVITQGEQTHFALDMKQVDSVWIIATRRHWQVELYDAEGSALAALLPDPHAPAANWRDLLCALPSR